MDASSDHRKRSAAAQQAWGSLSSRERRLVVIAGIFLAAAALGMGAVIPALKTWREAPAQLQAAQSRWSELQVMASEAARLRGLSAPAGAGGEPAITPRGLAVGLDAATSNMVLKPLGSSARLRSEGRSIIIEFASAAPEGLRESLRAIRQRLKVRIAELEVQVGDNGLSGQMVLEWNES